MSFTLNGKSDRKLITNDIPPRLFHIPKKASTCPAIPLIAFRNINGKDCKQGC